MLDGGLGSVVELDVGAESIVTGEEFKQCEFRIVERLIKVMWSYDKTNVYVQSIILNRDSCFKRSSVDHRKR